MQTFWQDVKYGWRILRQKPLFTLAAALTLALGIGANTAIFSVVNAVLLRPLPFRDAKRLVIVFAKTPTVRRDWVSYPDLLDWRKQNQSFEELAGYSSQSVNLTGVDEPTRVIGSFVTANFFKMLGLEPVHGRSFRPGDDEPGAQRVVLVSEGLWRSRYGADPNLLGKTMILNAEAFTVAGVMPNSFADTWFGTDVYLPLPSYPNFSLDRGRASAGIFGRLKPGTRIEQAQSEMETIAGRLAQQYPDTNRDRTVSLLPLREGIVEDMRRSVLVLFAAVGFVLLIACANVANLLLVRAASRRKEIATRAALGASRWRLVRQMLTETVMLWCVGAVLGLMLGGWGISALLALSPSQSVPTGVPVELDRTVLAFMLCVSIFTGILFGLIPALHYSRPDFNESLKEGSRTVVQGSGVLRGLLVVSQVALALVLLVASGLMARSFMRMQSVNPGFDGQNLLTMEYRVPRNKYPQPKQQWDFHRMVVERVKGVPGVRSAAVVFALPLSGNGGTDAFELPGREPPPAGRGWRAQVNRAHPETFATLGIPLLRGRSVTWQDLPDTPPVVLVSQSMVDKYWPSEDPLGKTIKFLPGGEVATVVGVAGNIKQFGLDDAMAPQIWTAFAQNPHIFATLAARTERDPMVLAETVRRAVWSVDKDQPVWKVRSMESLLDRSLGPRRFMMTLLGIYSALALVLAAVGIYGVMSYAVGQRTQEIGIRMSLGAQPRDILRLVLARGSLLSLCGIVLGMIAAFGLTRFLQAQLFEVKATDPVTFALAGVALTAVALLACYVPARRATKVDPMVALRYE
ncbi:MAG TPA: ABC transporter permease [Burkholderiales bacterium]|nr:ABC transporter permease [Burkholderiales bacterium]